VYYPAPDNSVERRRCRHDNTQRKRELKKLPIATVFTAMMAMPAFCPMDDLMCTRPTT
jgi:hypothetical protein